MSQTMNKEMINLLVATAQQVPRATVCEQDKVCTQNLAWYLIKRHNLTDCSSLSSDDACHGSSRLAYIELKIAITGKLTTSIFV